MHARRTEQRGQIITGTGFLRGTGERRYTWSKFEEDLTSLKLLIIDEYKGV